MKAIGENKRCSCCGETKHVSCFYANKREADGLHTQCKVCAREVSRRYYAANPGKIRKKRDRYLSAHPEARDRSNERSRKYQVENPKKAAAACRKYYAKNRDKILERRRMRNAAKATEQEQWRLEHAEKLRAAVKEIDA